MPPGNTAANHPWFSASKLAARSHFPLFEVPDRIAAAIEEWIGKDGRGEFGFSKGSRVPGFITKEEEEKR